MLCVENAGYGASLVVKKVYQALPDPAGEAHGMVRIVDDSGEDYLYPATYFVGIDVPSEAVRVFTAGG